MDKTALFERKKEKKIEKKKRRRKLGPALLQNIANSYMPQSKQFRPQLLPQLTERC